MNCANCNRPVPWHCSVHLIPCCPGKCPGRSGKPVASAPPGGVHIVVTQKPGGGFDVRQKPDA